MNWIDIIATAKSPAELRAALATRNPAFASQDLKSMIVIGAAGEGERICRRAGELGIEVLAVVDDNPAKVGTVMPGGAKVVAAVPEHTDREEPIVIASHRVLDAIVRMQRLGRSNVIGSGILQTIDPERFSPHSFYANWLEDMVANGDKYRQAYALLSDDRSRQIFMAMLGYRLTGDIRHLQPFVDHGLFYPRELFSLGEHEVYIDGGCYNGDTMRLFMWYVDGKFDRIIGFEPDPMNFQVLSRNFADEPRADLLPLGLYSDKRTLRFAGSHDRAAGLSDAGDIEVNVSSIDQELGGDRITYIKMNIEGAELAALEGAKNSIQRWKPKLCVSGYHGASHLWEVPLLIKTICPEYRIYLRQHDGGIVENTFYAVV